MADITRNRIVAEDDDDAPEPTPEQVEKLADAAEKALSGGLEARLFKQRKVLIFGEINDKIARAVTAQLLALAGADDAPIDVFVNSPGGHVESGDTIHDVIRFVSATAPVRMIGTGWVASACALIFLAGAKNHRYCLPNTRFLLHQPMGGVRGPATDIDIEAKEIIKMRERINRIIARETGQELARVERDTDRNYWMGAEEAITYGMVAKIVHSATEIG